MERLVSGKLTSKGQLTIPVELRNILNIEEGDRLEFVIDDTGSLSVTPKKKRSLKDVAGILRPNVELEPDEARDIAQQERGKQFMEKNP